MTYSREHLDKNSDETTWNSKKLTENFEVDAIIEKMKKVYYGEGFRTKSLLLEPMTSTSTSTTTPTLVDTSVPKETSDSELVDDPTTTAPKSTPTTSPTPTNIETNGKFSETKRNKAIDKAKKSTTVPYLEYLKYPTIYSIYMCEQLTISCIKLVKIIPKDNDILIITDTLKTFISFFISIFIFYNVLSFGNESGDMDEYDNDNKTASENNSQTGGESGGGTDSNYTPLKISILQQSKTADEISTKLPVSNLHRYKSILSLLSKNGAIFKMLGKIPVSVLSDIIKLTFEPILVILKNFEFINDFYNINKRNQEGSGKDEKRIKEARENVINKNKNNNTIDLNNIDSEYYPEVKNAEDAVIQEIAEERQRRDEEEKEKKEDTDDNLIGLIIQFFLNYGFIFSNESLFCIVFLFVFYSVYTYGNSFIELLFDSIQRVFPPNGGSEKCDYKDSTTNTMNLDLDLDSTTPQNILLNLITLILLVGFFRKVSEYYNDASSSGSNNGNAAFASFNFVCFVLKVLLLFIILLYGCVSISGLLLFAFLSYVCFGQYKVWFKIFDFGYQPKWINTTDVRFLDDDELKKRNIYNDTTSNSITKTICRYIFYIVGILILVNGIINVSTQIQDINLIGITVGLNIFVIGIILATLYVNLPDTNENNVFT
jgi:hypothetical protein